MPETVSIWVVAISAWIRGPISLRSAAAASSGLGRSSRVTGSTRWYSSSMPKVAPARAGRGSGSGEPSTGPACSSDATRAPLHGGRRRSRCPCCPDAGVGWFEPRENRTTCGCPRAPFPRAATTACGASRWARSGIDARSSARKGHGHRKMRSLVPGTDDACPAPFTGGTGQEAHGARTSDAIGTAGAAVRRGRRLLPAQRGLAASAPTRRSCSGGSSASSPSPSPRRSGGGRPG